MFVVRDQDVASGRIAAQMTWLAAQTRLMAQRRKLALCIVYAKRPIGAAIEAQPLPHRKEEPPRRIEGQKGWIDYREGVQERELPVRRVAPENLNPLGPA